MGAAYVFGLNTTKKVNASEGIERRGLVLSMLMQLKQTCNHPAQYLHQADGGPVEAAIAERSGKLTRLVELLEEIVAVGDRALIFTQFAEMGRLLHDYLAPALGCPTLVLHGGVPAPKRDQMVKRFQEEGHGPFLEGRLPRTGGLRAGSRRWND
jgi:SNF2 family DNA or RNA helicase